MSAPEGSMPLLSRRMNICQTVHLENDDILKLRDLKSVHSQNQQNSWPWSKIKAFYLLVGYGLNANCPHRLICLAAWLLSDWFVLGSYAIFGTEKEERRTGSPGTDFEAYIYFWFRLKISTSWYTALKQLAPQSYATVPPLLWWTDVPWHNKSK